MATQPRTRTLQRICTMGRIAGWAMIITGLFGIGCIVVPARSLFAAVGTYAMLRETVWVVGHLLTGLIILGTVQFIGYATEEGTELRWLLRHGHVFLYLFALFVFMTSGFQYLPPLWNGLEMVFSRSPENLIPMGRPIGVVWFILIGLVQTVPKSLAVAGLAVVLRTVLPILGESKTLA